MLYNGDEVKVYTAMGGWAIAKIVGSAGDGSLIACQRKDGRISPYVNFRRGKAMSIDS